MSLTAIIWALLALVLLAASIVRPVWSVALYMMTFFAAPHLWWWGRDLPSLRYAYLAGFALLVAVVIHSGNRTRGADRTARVTAIAGLAMVLNATFVHYVLTDIPLVSFDTYLELIKFVLLYFLITAAVRDRSDLAIVVVSLALGAAYLGYEVTINERGNFKAGRLEDVGAPGADTANGLASMLLLILPVIGSLFIGGTRWHKALVMIAAPLALNVVIMCNSRGAFIGLIGGGLVFLFLARGPSRKHAVRVLALGATALYLLLGDPEILERFTTTFVGAEERDRSASSRIEFWKAGAVMVADYPLGAGGGAFKFVYGSEYLARVGSLQQARALHNGYLTEATDWGLQGLGLKLLFIGSALVLAYRTMKRCREEHRSEDALVGIAYIAAMSSFLIVCMFGSYLASEWTYWMVALLVRYAQIYAPVPAAGTAEAAPAPRLTGARAAVA